MSASCDGWALARSLAPSAGRPSPPLIVLVPSLSLPRLPAKNDFVSRSQETSLWNREYEEKKIELLKEVNYVPLPVANNTAYAKLSKASILSIRNFKFMLRMSPLRREKREI